MAFNRRRLKTQLIYTKPVGIHTTAKPPVRAPLVISLAEHLGQRSRISRYPKPVRLRKPKAFGVQAPNPFHPKIKVYLAPRTSRTVRTLRGRFKFISVGGYQTFKAPLYKIRTVLVNRYAGKRPRPQIATRFINPVRFHNPIVQPTIRPKKLLQTIAPKRRFQKGTVKFLKRFGVITKRPPVRSTRIVSLITRRRRLPQIKTRLGRVLRNFGVTNVPVPSSYIPTFRPRRR